MAEIMASLDSINAYLDGGAVDPDVAVVTATDENTDLIQISVSRIVRGYLAGIFDPLTLHGWNTPELTPDVVEEVAAMLIASQLYMDKVSGQEFTVEDQHYSQILYNRAIATLEGIISGAITVTDDDGNVIGGGGVSGTSLDEADFWPNDDTNRAFSMGMQLD